MRGRRMMNLITVTLTRVTEPLSLRSRDAILILCAFLFSATAANAQGTILQGGPWAPGHAPMYTGQGSGQAVVQDSGPAGGGGTGYGLSEQLLVARGTGTPPYVGQGTGPLGTNWCDYDAPITNATGYHYICLSANAQGGALIAIGASGASTQPLYFDINGILYQFPGTGSGTVVGPTTSVINDAACWNNTVGSLLKDCGGPPVLGPGSATSGDVAVWNNGAGTLLKDTPPLQIFGTQAANTVLAGPGTGSAANPTFRALVPADIASIFPAGIDQNLLNVQTTTYAVATTDCGKTIQLGGGTNWTLTLPAVSGFPATCSVLLKNTDNTTAKTLSGFPTDIGTVFQPYASVGIKIVNGAWVSFYGPVRSGTWTPVLTFQTPGDLSVAYTTQFGVFERIGNLVFVDVDIVTSTFTFSTASGELQVTGLPFHANEQYNGMLEFQNVNKASYTAIMAATSTGGNLIDFDTMGMGQSLAVVQASNMSSGSVTVIRFTLWYQTNDP
jgi:hypothetical protein